MPTVIDVPLPTIYCISPSGRLLDPTTAQKGVAFLEQQGFTVLNTEIFSRQFERFAGTDQERADEINGLCAQVEQHGPVIALATRGGFGVNRILHLIDWERLGKAVQKGLQLVGHSDITALHLGLLNKTGQTSFAGPMLSFDFGRETIDAQDITYQYFLNSVVKRALNLSVQTDQPYCEQATIIERARIWGGNLALVQSLLGTPYFPQDVSNGILFLEDVNEHPYRIERMLWQLLDSGVLASQKAILLGDFSEYRLSDLDQTYTLSSAITRIQQELRNRGHKTIFLTDLPFGHIPNKCTIEVGRLVNLHAASSGYRLCAAD